MSDDPDCQFIDDDMDFAGLQVICETRPKPQTAAFSPTEAVPLIEISTLPSERVVRHKSEIPLKFQRVFDQYPYFNVLQSKLLPDLVYEDNSVGVCAPTGSGKTALFELAIIRILMQHDEHQPEEKFIDKIIYMSPLKSICSERRQDWSLKFEPLGVRVCELTGDSDNTDHSEAHKSNIIITTPEKWDSMTRKWRDSNRTIMMQTRLICIDEVHLLSEPNRGATLETIVSRVKTAKKQSAGTPKPDRALIRFVAVSATAPNITDVAQWLSVSGFPGKAYKMAQSDRPVKLTQLVIGVKCSSSNPYAFENLLRNPIRDAITTHGQGKPVLVFCMTRNSTLKSAKELFDDLPLERDMHKVRDRRFFIDKIKNDELKRLMEKGIAFHNAGCETSDRLVIEDAFRHNVLLALFSTSTLAMGVNLPAYMVILKGVHKVAGRSANEELSETELMQMTGRAGRPQFDDHGFAVILCPERDQAKYQRLMNGEKVLESSLHKNLPEHMNSEIVLKTIDQKSLAVDWLKSTFFYIRCLKNKRFYGISPNSNQAQVDQHLSTLCNKELNGLNKYGMIEMTADGSSITPTAIGSLMAHYCVSFETMKSFVSVKPGSTLPEVLMLLSSCKEVKQEIVLRTDEKKSLFSFSDPKDATIQKIRFPLNHKIREVEHKVYTIWQIEFSLFDQSEAITKFRSDVTKTLKVGRRMVKCLLEIVTLPEMFSKVGARSLRNVTLLCQIVNAGMWENSAHVARQLHGIGPKYSTDLVRAGKRTFDQMRSMFSYELEAICSRKHPFGDDLLRRVRGLPIYQITGRQLLEGPNHSRADITVRLMNCDTMNATAGYKDGRGITAGRNHTVHLCISDSDDKVVAYCKIKDESLLREELHETVILSQSNREPKNKFTLTLMSDSWIGIDPSRREFGVRFPFLEAVVDHDLFPQNYVTDPPIEPHTETIVTSARVRPSHPAVVSLPKEISAVSGDMANEMAPPCNHKCRDKSLCLHDCCKTSAQMERAVRISHPVQKSAQVAKKMPSKSTSSIIRKGIKLFDKNRVNGPDDAPIEGPAAAMMYKPVGTYAQPQPEPRMALFPKPIGYHNKSVSPVQSSAASLEQSPVPHAFISASNRTVPKRRAVYVEDDDDDDDLGGGDLEVISSHPSPAASVATESALSLHHPPKYELLQPTHSAKCSGYGPVSLNLYREPVATPTLVTNMMPSPPDFRYTPTPMSGSKAVSFHFPVKYSEVDESYDDTGISAAHREQIRIQTAQNYSKFRPPPPKKYRSPGEGGLAIPPLSHTPSLMQSAPLPVSYTPSPMRSAPLPMSYTPSPMQSAPLPVSRDPPQRNSGIRFSELQPVPEFSVKLPVEDHADYLTQLKLLTDFL